MTPTTLNPAGQGSIMESLYALAENPEAEITPKAEAPKTAAAETSVQTEAKTIEPAQAAGETKQEPTDEDDHTPLPPKAQKRLDRLIAETVSLRKELEAKVKAAETTPAKQGTEPVKPAAEAAIEKPKRPILPEFGEGKGNEDETWDKFKERVTKYHADVESYDDAITQFIIKTTEAETRNRFDQQKAREVHQATVQQAIKDHGEDFIALTEQVASKAPLPLQYAILEIEDWPTTAVYLARNADRLGALVEQFAKNPTAAIITLGRIAASLKGPTPKSSAIEEKQLPGPLKPIAGSGTIATTPDLNKLAAEKPGALQAELRKQFPERVVKYG